MPRLVSIPKGRISVPRFGLIGSHTFRQQLLKYTNIPLSREDQGIGVFVCFLFTEPWGDGHFLTVSFFATIPLNS